MEDLPPPDLPPSEPPEMIDELTEPLTVNQTDKLKVHIEA